MDAIESVRVDHRVMLSRLAMTCHWVELCLHQESDVNTIASNLATVASHLNRDFELHHTKEQSFLRSVMKNNDEEMEIIERLFEEHDTIRKLPSLLLDLSSALSKDTQPASDIANLSHEVLKLVDQARHHISLEESILTEGTSGKSQIDQS